MYVIDTNIYLDWWDRRYPSYIFPSVKTNVESLIASGKWISVEGVATELKHVGTPGLKNWALLNKVHFHPHDADVLKEAAAISAAYPGLIDPYASHDEADRYIIALAKLKKFCVVTHETSARSKSYAARSDYVPDVCAKLGIQCFELLTVMHKEKWSF